MFKIKGTIYLQHDNIITTINLGANGDPKYWNTIFGSDRRRFLRELWKQMKRATA